MTPPSQCRRDRSNGDYDNDNDDGQRLMRQRTRSSSNHNGANSKYGTRNHYQPGQPIGFLAARNTIYAKKINSRKLRCCLFLVMPIAVLVGLVILTGPVLFAVATHIVNVSVVHLKSLEISTTQPAPGEYPVSLRARVTKTGIFPARAYFRAPINLYWRTVPPNSREIHIGTIEIDHLGVTSRGYGTLDENKTLTNVDDDNLALFARYLVNAEQATIKLNCSNVHTVAFGFLPSWHNIAVSKHANIAGLKGLGDVKVLSLDVPGDSPQGGAIVNAVGSLKNPSPFSIQLGNADLQMSYKDMPLAEANLTNFHLGNGINFVPVDGRIYHQQGEENLAKLSELVGILTNNEAAPVSIKVNPTSETTPSWVKAAVDELNIEVPVKLPQPFDPIKAVQVGAMDVMLDPAQSYSPTLNSDSVSADVEIPFGLSLSVLSAAVHIDVSTGDHGGTATLSGAQANASSALELIGPSERGGKTFLSLINSTMSPSSNINGGDAEAKKGFQQLIQEIALGNTIDMTAKGTAAVVADSSIGRITLPDLKIATSTSLQGLSGFAQAPLDLLSFDILGGSSSALQVIASASITNPSLISIHLLGDTSFPLALPNGAHLGRSTISDVRLVPGANTVNVTAAVSFNDKSKSLVQQYLQGKGSQVSVRGDADSSQAQSLKPTMESLKLNATIAGLADPLLLSAAMRILDTTAVVNDIADATPSVGNPFTSAISLRGTKGQASVLGLNVGHVDAMNLQNAVVIPSRNEVNRQSNQPLPVVVDFDKPNMIFGLMRGLVVESGQNTAPLDYLMKVGGIKPVGVKQSASSLPTLSLRAAPFDGFSLPKYVMTALAAARADVQVDVDVLIGNYPLSTPFQQSGVNVTFDNSIAKLYSILGRPIMQAVIDAVQINLDSVQVLDLAQNKVVVDVSTAITKIGPFDAVVMLDKGIDVSWQGKVIGNVALPNVTIVPETTPLQVRAELTIADTGLMTDLVKALLQQESVEWTLSTSSMVIYAYDAVLNGPGLTKKTSIRAFNKLQNAVALGPFDLPANDPAGGIHITASATVRNPSNIGVNLDRLGVNFGLTTSTLGEVGLANVLNMTASGTSTVNVAGRILPQSGQGLTDFSTVAQNFISNKPTTLTVRGVYAGPDSVTWLTDGIKALSIPITVPGIVLDPLKSVSLNSTTIDFTQAGGEWSPLLSTDTVAAVVEVPFGFPFGVESVGGSFDLLYGGQGAARLVLSDTAARTQDRTVSVAIQNAHLEIPGNYRNNFANGLAVRAVQDQSISVGLNSNAVNALVSTASGDISVKGIPIRLDPALALNAFQRLSTSPIVISGLDVTGGTRDYAIATVNAAIVNPSQVHAIVGDVRMQVDYGNGGSIGDALVRNVNIPQGPITLPVEAQLKLNSDVGRQLIKDFLTRGGPDIEALAHGTSRSTAYGSLNPAVSTLSFGASVARLKETLVTTAKLIVPPNVDNRLVVAATFVLHNPFSAQITVLHAKASATSLSGALLGTVDADVNMVAPRHSTLTSPQFPVRVNTDFAAVIGFFEDQAKANNVDLAPLLPLIDPLKSRSKLNSNVAFAPAQSEGCPLNGATNVIGALQRSLQGAQVSADAQADVLVGQYRINDVPVQLQPIALEVDDSVRYLIGPFGAPVVESLVNSFTLQVANISASNLAEDSLDVSVSVTIGGIGPFAAQVSFGKPIEARYKGKRIATVSVPTFCLPADGRLDLDVRLTVTDQNGFGDFVSDLIAQSELELEIYSDDVRANAYGVQFSKISFSRSISLQGLKGLPGVLARTVSVVGETSDTLLVEADATVPWPTSIRVVLPIINVDFRYENVVLGGVLVPAGVVLAPNTDTNLHVTGQVNRLTNNAQSTALGHLASRFISTNKTAVEVVGNSATDANGQNILWLTRALKTLDLNVDVAGQNLSPVKGINLPDLYADLTAAKDSGYQLPLSTNRTETIVSIPYNIHVDAVSASGTVYVATEGSTARAASVILDQLPLVSGAIAGNNQSNTLTLSLKNQMLTALDRDAFQQLLVVVVSRPTAAVRIFGQVSAVVDLAVGRITVGSINLDGTASLQSLDNLSGQLDAIGLADITGGTPEHGIAMIKAMLHNPSVISAKVAELSIPVTLDGVGIGRAVLQNLDLKPGDNTVSVTFYIKLDEPLGSPTAVKLIRQLIQPVPGTRDPYITTLYAHNRPGAQPPITDLDALNPALDTLDLKLDLTGFALELIRQATISIEVLDLFAGPGGLPYVLADIDLQNGLPTDLALNRIVADGSKAGSSKTYATLDHTFDPSLILPKAAATNVDPGQVQAHIDKVLLPMGLLNSIDIVGSPLDLYIKSALIKIGGDNGYQLQGELTYLSVPATYRLTLAGAVIANIDSLGGLLGALGGIVGSLSPNEQKLLSDGLQNLGTGNILGLVDNGFKDLVCVLNDLPIPLLSQANCAQATSTTVSVSTQSVSLPLSASTATATPSVSSATPSAAAPTPATSAPATSVTPANSALATSAAPSSARVATTSASPAAASTTAAANPLAGLLNGLGG